MRITEYVEELGQQWTQANGLSLSRLGTMVANDGKFFDRLAAGTMPRIGTIEKFLAFFRDGANWPDNVIPLQAAELLDRLENIAHAAAAESPDNAAANIGQAA